MSFQTRPEDYFTNIKTGKFIYGIRYGERSLFSCDVPDHYFSVIRWIISHNDPDATVASISRSLPHDVYLEVIRQLENAFLEASFCDEGEDACDFANEVIMSRPVKDNEHHEMST